VGKLHLLADELQRAKKSPGEIEIINKLNKVKEIREYFTYKGLIKQIAHFFNDPLGKLVA
jgi:hypothetical protein